MTPSTVNLMTLVYATLAFAAGAGLAYAWQAMRIRQVEAARDQTVGQLTRDLDAKERAYLVRASDLAAVQRELRDIKERRSAAGHKAARTREERRILNGNPTATDRPTGTLHADDSGAVSATRDD